MSMRMKLVPVSKTNAERQKAWRARQTAKREAVQEAIRAIDVKVEISWEIRPTDRPILEAAAAEKGLDLDTWLREWALKKLLARLPDGVGREKR